jgi:hypothetical protein
MIATATAAKMIETVKTVVMPFTRTPWRASSLVLTIGGSSLMAIPPRHADVAMQM